jgi:hypothetical protein
VNPPRPEQLTLDGRSEPHEEVVKSRERSERTELAKIQRELTNLRRREEDE